MKTCPSCGRVFDEARLKFVFDGRDYDTIDCVEEAARRTVARAQRERRQTAPATRADARTTTVLEPARVEISEAAALRRRLVRLAYDIHDGPMQSLTGIGYLLRDLQRRTATDRTLDRQALEEGLQWIVAELSSLEKELRALITRLGHVSPEIETIEEIADVEIAAFEAHSPAVVNLDLASNFEPESASQAIAIRAVLREALTNVAHHANASHVNVRVEAGEEAILIEIQDDGDGFDPAAVRRDALGLVTMRHRVELLGGTFSIHSQAGGPTVVTAQCPHWQPRPDDRPTDAASDRRTGSDRRSGRDRRQRPVFVPVERRSGTDRRRRGRRASDQV